MLAASDVLVAQNIGFGIIAVLMIAGAISVVTRRRAAITVAAARMPKVMF